MSIWARARTYAGHAIDRLLPGDCLLCGATVAPRRQPGTPCTPRTLCAACIADLPPLPPGCPACALPTPGATLCGHCLAHPPHFDATQALWAYAFPLDRLIHALKYTRRLASADFLGEALAAVPLSPRMPQVPRPDLIVPVPLTPARLAERGFNQAREIARALARRSGIALDTDGVIRIRDARPQAELPWKERRANMRHAFECRLDLSGKTVLVIDDVMTSGATLDELARTLKAHGAARVENRVAARTLRD